ncbi:MAG: biotin carboxylase N-terminal domain-containing protein [Desulfosarcinaceae bacterium]
MISSVLIANRGEIVARIIRTCKEMGISTIAVYSEADKNAPYLQWADDAVRIGPANPAQSYLNIPALIDAARKTGAQAVHPGYGFLSERGAFAEAVADAGLIWVGPSPKILRAISSKSRCREVAASESVPVIPGTLGLVKNAAEVADFGRENGWPVFLKLDKGGGGKGIERVNGGHEAEVVFDRARRIGEMAFGSGDIYIEAVVDRPRHIEVQFLADGHGKCVCLGERECSVQRRHQKIIEEALSVVVTEADRQQLSDRTRRIVRAIGYTGAGTLEFLRSEKGDYYFMEINARLQVEHPVSEYVTGIDIVRWQLAIASGESLDFSQQEVRFDGHAIEARVYAEDPETFIPSPGTITGLTLPKHAPHLRIDHALQEHTTVPPFYDPLLAKVIAWGEDRDSACDRLHEALSELRIEGVKTTTPLNLRILEHPAFRKGEIDTGFIDKLP